MSDKVRLVLHVDADAAALLDELTTPRGKGEYLSELVRRESKRLQTAEAGILERIEAKIDALLAK